MSKKLIEKEINATDIREYLDVHDDFALEIFVLKCALSKDFLVEHGGTYTDPSTGKFRQFDLRATQQQYDFRIALAIECKSLKKNFPLVISRLKRSNIESFHECIYSKQATDYRISHYYDESIIIRDNINSFYKVGEYVGKSSIQIGRDNQKEFTASDGEAYDKWNQALNSANEIIYSSFNYFPPYSSNRITTLVIPVLVVPNDTLWVVDYEENGEIVKVPISVDEAQLYVNREYKFLDFPTYKISHMHFYTKNGICEFLDRIKNSKKIWFDIFRDGRFFG